MDKKEEKGESEKCEEKKNIKSPSGFYSLQKQDGPV